MKSLINCFEDIVRAAWEGYRNCESDAKDGVEGAAEAMKKYGDALDPDILTAIKKVLWENEFKQKR